MDNPLSRLHQFILILCLLLASFWVGHDSAERLIKQVGVAPEISIWWRENAVPFDTTEPGSSFDDLMPLKDVIGDARIVALGEATHGTHEFFQMKHRLLEFLVREMGFNVFAIEATWPESNLVNDYVHSGQGDPAGRLKGLYFWTWNTQEVLDMIRWIRSHNENPGDASRVSFLGFDMQYPGMAMDNVVEYLEQVDPEMAARATASYRCFRDYKHRTRDYTGLPLEAKTECRGSLQAVYDELSQRQISYETRFSPETFALALQSARVVLQAEDMYGSGDYGATRDRYMAENVAWLLDQAGPDAKIVLWAHNAHVGMDAFGAETMGSYLHERYGDQMVVFGFSFYGGAFNAISWGDSSFSGMTEFQIALPPEGSYAHYFYTAGLPRFFLDLRDLQAGTPAADWLLAPHPFRSIGAVYDQTQPKAYFQTVALPQVFDVIIYIQDTTPSLLLGQQAVIGGPPPVQPADFGPGNLDFEIGTSGWSLAGDHPQDYVIGDDSTVVHRGNASGYIRSIRDPINGFGTLMQTLWAISEYKGQRLRMSAYAKTEDVAGWAGFWLRVDAAEATIAFDNMQDRPIRGDTDWTYYELVLDVPENGAAISFGILLQGAGQVWVDDFQFEPVGQDVPTTH